MMNLYSGTTCPFSQRCRIVLYEKFGERLPKALWDEHRALEARLQTELSGKAVAAAE